MIAYIVTIHVKPEFADDFISASVENHRGTRTEPGNLRFDLVRRVDDPAVFLLYEVYESEDAVAAHKETAHYLAWRETVADWMALPRVGVKHVVVCPTEQTAW
jgi:(4S)-4-hydroxy-5-phosphonooxypentane-2,3-dione isomerase